MLANTYFFIIVILISHSHIDNYGSHVINIRFVPTFYQIAVVKESGYSSWHKCQATLRHHHMAKTLPQYQNHGLRQMIRTQKWQRSKSGTSTRFVTCVNCQNFFWRNVGINQILFWPYISKVSEDVEYIQQAIKNICCKHISWGIDYRS